MAAETLTCGQVAEAYQVSNRTIHNWVAKHDMPCYSTPGGHLRFDPSRLVIWSKEQGMPVPEAITSKA